MQPLLDEGDTFARIGGDEFVIIKEQLNDLGIADTLAQQILTQMQTTPFLIARSFHYLGVSIGISLFPQNADNPKKLVQTAEMAMYRAKKEGKNRYTFYNKSLSEALYRQMEIENSLRDALENGEFELYYQPQYAMYSGKITGAEALIRWNSKTLGHVSPAEFIPIAERNRLILPIGKWVMYEACRAASDWQREGIFDGTIAVNLSGVQMGEDLGLIDMIDDFGTGYSSLSYLRHFPLDLLKIDKSFVDDLPRDNDSSAITKAVVALAKSLGLATIAEGIETEAQLHYLRDIGCDYAQGYHFSKPLSHKDFTQLLQNRK